jgi:hypothetical protein
MPVPNARPDRVPENLKWTRVKIECKKSIKGWLAGQVFGVEGHGTPSFKPCHQLFSSGSRACPWCAIPKFATVKYQGYLPMYDERLKRTVICVNLDVTALTDKMQLLAPIELVKGPYPTSPIWLKGGEPWTSIKPSGPGIRSTPQDLVPWLTSVLWRAEGLQEFAGDAQPGVQAQVEVQPVVEPAEPPKESAREALRRGLKKRGFNKSALFFGDDPNEAVPPPSTNGHHQKKGS